EDAHAGRVDLGQLGQVARGGLDVVDVAAAEFGTRGKVVPVPRRAPLVDSEHGEPGRHERSVLVHAQVAPLPVERATRVGRAYDDDRVRTGAGRQAQVAVDGQAVGRHQLVDHN